MLSKLFCITSAWQKAVQEGCYTYDEKVEYWAFVWGTVVMVITGFMMWILATPPAAWRVHCGGQNGSRRRAMLAVLAIILWHLYNVLVRSRNRVFNGYLTRGNVRRPAELADSKPA